MWVTGHLPYKMLYLISDLFFLIIYYIIPYRKKIVFKNLRYSFPDLDEKQIKQISKQFYRHLCDLGFESVTGGFKKIETLKKRMVLKNPEVCDDLFNKGKDICLLMSHYGNWEWTNIFEILLQHRLLAIYKPLNNKYIDRMFVNFRERFGLRAVPMEKILRVLIDHKKQGKPTLTLFLADQRPMRSQIQHWLTFLNQDTPVLLGPEKISVKMNMAVIYLKINKLKRGYYEAEFVLMFEDPCITSQYEITAKYYEVMESVIREKPQYWLWSHNRWKHKRKTAEKNTAPPKI